MTPTSYDLQPGHLIAGKYRVVRQLGAGGMGQVFLVTHAKTDERFAMKILNSDVVHNDTTRERFRREARTPARIDSDHVARVVDSDIAADLGGAPFLVMEYLRGRNLQELSDGIGPLPPREVLVYLRQIAIALDKAHAIGVVHRDLKPENLFLTTRDDGSPCVKVLDFGIAKLSGATGDLANIKATSTGDVFGTPLFMSPEQCKSEAEKVSAQTDIWALGLVTFRLLMGDDFWTANTLTHLIAQIAYEDLPTASERGAAFGPEFDAWFARCCSREPLDRFPSAGDAVTKLSKALGLDGESTGQLSLDLVAAEVARLAGTSQGEIGQGELEASSEPLKHTSAAMTRDQPGELEPAGRRSRLALVAFAIVMGGALGVFGAGWFVGAFDGRSNAAPTRADAVVDTEPATVDLPEQPIGAASSEVDPSEKTAVADASASPSGSGSAGASATASASTAVSARPVTRRAPPRPAATRRPPVVRPPVKPKVDPLSGRH
jgi:serine/threonine protein kinase